MGGSSSKYKQASVSVSGGKIDAKSQATAKGKIVGAVNSTCRTSGLNGSKKSPQAQGSRIKCSSCLSAGCLPENPVQGRMFIYAVPCGHRYCEPCIAKLCSLGVHDRSMVPAHCCGIEFPTEYAKKALGDANFSIYARYLTERQWQATNLRSDAAYAATVKNLGGMQCPRCGIGVTRISGCATMHCICGRTFDYTGRIG